MSVRTLALVVVTAAIVGTVAFWAGGQRTRTATAPPTAATGPVARPPANAAPPTAGKAEPTAAIEFGPNELLLIRERTISRSIPLTGSLQPVRETLVKAKVAGELRDLAVREGTSVRAGQLLARIDPTEFEWRVKEREAQLRSAEAQLEQAKRTLDNNRQLSDKGFISTTAADNARSAHDGAIGARDAAIAQLTMARKALADTQVTAPMSGVIAGRFAQVGEKVSPDNRIVSIIDLSRMEIEALVPSGEIASVRIGQAVSLAVEGIDGKLAGQIVRISPATQSGTRSIPVHIGVDNRDPRIRAGMFAQGWLPMDRQEHAIVVPIAAIREDAGRPFVYLIDNDRVIRREVVLGVRDESASDGGSGSVQVLSGLKTGDRIVAVNLGTLREGATVRRGPAGEDLSARAAEVAPPAAVR